MLYQLKYRDDLLSEKGNVPEEVVVREIISKFVNDIPIEELKSLFGFEKRELDYEDHFFDYRRSIIEYSLKLNTYMRDMHNLRDIQWVSRYSDTMTSDKQGRWARIAYIGNQDNFGFDENNRRYQHFEIAWVSKKEINEETHYVVTYRFPDNNKHLFDTLDEAKEEVENSFKQFIKSCFK